MDLQTIYFIITMGAVICVNGAFFMLMLAFAVLIAAIQWYYQRKTQAVLKQAITDTQAMLTKPSTYGKLIKTLRTSMMKSYGGMLTSGGKQFRNWIKKAGGTEQEAGLIEGAFSMFGEFMGKTPSKTKKIKKIGKQAQYVYDKLSAVQQAKEEAAPAIQLTEEQQLKLQKYQNKILTKEQKEALGIAEAGKKKETP